MIPLLVTSGAVGLVAATQTIAHACGYAPALGAPLFSATSGQGLALRLGSAAAVAAGGIISAVRSSWKPFFPGLGVGVLLGVVSLAPVYNPVLGVSWGLRLSHVHVYQPITRRAAITGAAVGGGLFLLGMATEPRPAPRRPSRAFGTARFGDVEPLKAASGPIIGRDGGELLRYPGDGHLITFAPTGSGKGVGAVLPNCLMYPGSLVVSDPKGENAAVSARARREMGQRVAWLDPWKVLSPVGGETGEDGFNPMDFIDPSSDDANDDAWLIAEQLVPPNYHAGDEAHFLDQARAFLAGLTLHLGTTRPKGDEERSLPYLRHCVCLPDQEFESLLNAMEQNPASGGSVARVSTLFRRIMQRSEKEFGSIMSTVARHTWFLDSPRIQKAMTRSTFDLLDLKRGKLSVFISIPQDRLDTYAPWCRIMVSCALSAVTRVVGRPRHKVLVILDELGNLGPMAPVVRAVTLIRGSGATIWAIFQDVSQPKALYDRRWGTFFANADVLQTYGTNDHDTASLLSAMAGEETIVVESASASLNRNRGGRGGASNGSAAGVSASERGRKLLMPDEVRRLDSNRQLVFLRGSDPLMIDRVCYHKDPEFSGLFDPNPTFRSVREAGGIE